jgi:hydrogenase-4 membrane subunit HyfE
MADDSQHRNETKAEKLDRNWNDMLQELRVVQTGVQLLSGFLLTLPFTERFTRIDVWQERLYLALVVTAGLAVGATLTPVMVHRRVFGQQVKDRVVASGHIFLQIVMTLLALIIVGITTLIFSVVLSWSAGTAVAIAMAAALALLLVVLPLVVARRNARP